MSRDALFQLGISSVELHVTQAEASFIAHASQAGGLVFSASSAGGRLKRPTIA